MATKRAALTHALVETNSTGIFPLHAELAFTRMHTVLVGVIALAP